MLSFNSPKPIRGLDTLSQRTSMGPHRKLGIYVGYETPSIIKYLEPINGDLHMTRYADCVFDEDHFPALGGDKHPEERREIEWNAMGLQSIVLRTSESLNWKFRGSYICKIL